MTDEGALAVEFLWLHTFLALGVVPESLPSPEPCSAEESAPVADPPPLTPALAAPPSATPVLRGPHRCAVCSLNILQLHGSPVPAAEAPVWRTFVQDELYAEQTGPMCAAACIATIARSFGALHGLEREHLDSITQAYTTDLYVKLGITGLEKSTAKVGNLTLKRAIRLFVFPGRPRWQLVPVDFDVHFGAGDDPALRNTLRWERLNRDLKGGTRFLFHSNNHYARIFGVRELKNQTHRSALPDEGAVVYALPPKTAAPTPPAPNAGTVGPSAAPQPAIPARSLADGGDSDNEDDPVEADVASESKENQAGASHDGSVAGKPLPTLAAPGHIAPIAAPERPALPALLAPSTPAIVPAGSATPLAEAKPGCKLVSWLRSGREILMARSGQSPKHWVDWDQVCRSIDTHRIQTLIAVRWVERAGGTT